jgi:hypothetical protein
MRRSLASALLLTALVGCPEPVATDGAAGLSGGGDGAAPSAAGGGGGGPSAMGGAMGSEPPMAAGGPAGGPSGGAGVIPDADLEPKFSQEELADGNTISGTLVCGDCSGKLLVRVLPPPPDQGGQDEGIVLITARSFDAAGAFEIKVPADRKEVVLQIVEDSDDNGKPSAGERMGLPVDGPVKVAGDVTGVTLEVGVFPQMPAVDQTGSAINTPPEGTPNPTPPGAEGSVEGGAPPAGGDPGGLPEGPTAPGAPPANAAGG